MPVITLKFKKKKIADYPLEKGRSITIGRRSSNDVVIENLAVSGHHAKIDSVGDSFVLTDLQSKNGSYVNDQMITSHWLKDNDVILIGKHTLVFAYQDGEARPQDETGKIDRTMVMDTGTQPQQKDQSNSEPVSKAQKSEPVGVLAYLAGGDGEVELNKKLFKIGKEPASDIVVSGLGVGQTAATISLRPNGYYLSHVGGFVKTKINGEPVKESKQLMEFDVIEIGSKKMQFFTKD
jgi:pSer/pThr/pTyr-binding forkhead associated (FHA) protein